MAIIPQLPAMHIIDGMRGTLDFYVLCRHGAAKTACVRKWPVMKKANMTEGSIAAQLPFAEAARAVAMVDQDVQKLYAEMAEGTGWTWKDVAMSLFLNPVNIYSVV